MSSPASVRRTFQTLFDKASRSLWWNFSEPFRGRNFYASSRNFHSIFSCGIIHVRRDLIFFDRSIEFQFKGDVSSSSITAFRFPTGGSAFRFPTGRCSSEESVKRVFSELEILVSFSSLSCRRRRSVLVQSISFNRRIEIASRKINVMFNKIFGTLVRLSQHK